MWCVLYWVFLTVVDFMLAFFVWYPFAPIVSLFTRKNNWSCFKWFGTWDNPPQGDRGWIEKRSPFPNVTDGVKGYWNRTMWLWRNNGYGYAKFCSIKNEDIETLRIYGNEDVSDKYKVSGSYAVIALNSSKEIIAFEYYCVYPWLFGKCFRARIGWKLNTSKLEEYGFAQLVNTINPFKSYG